MSIQADTPRVIAERGGWRAVSRVRRDGKFVDLWLEHEGKDILRQAKWDCVGWVGLTTATMDDIKEHTAEALLTLLITDLPIGGW